MSFDKTEKRKEGRLHENKISHFTNRVLLVDIELALLAGQRLDENLHGFREDAGEGFGERARDGKFGVAGNDGIHYVSASRIFYCPAHLQLFKVTALHRCRGSSGMARDTNKPQGKPYVFEPPVHKFREKMGKRETHQV